MLLTFRFPVVYEMDSKRKRQTYLSEVLGVHETGKVVNFIK
jgi:hypothetical protein